MRGLRSNFVGCESFPEPKYLGFFAHYCSSLSFTLKFPTKCQKFLNTEITKVVKKLSVKCFRGCIYSSVKTFCHLSPKNFTLLSMCKVSVMMKVCKVNFTKNKFSNLLLLHCLKMFLRISSSLTSSLLSQSK